MPDHPDHQHNAEQPGKRRPLLLAVAIVAVLVLFVVLHVTGTLGPNRH